MAFPKYRPRPSPKDRLIIEKRIVDGKMRKVETYNGKVARVYDDAGKLLEDRSAKLKIVSPTPPLEPKKILEKILEREDKKEEKRLPEDVANKILEKRQEIVRLEKEGRLEDASKLENEIDKEMESYTVQPAQTISDNEPILSIPSFSITTNTSEGNKMTDGTGLKLISEDEIKPNGSKEEPTEPSKVDIVDISVSTEPMPNPKTVLEEITQTGTTSQQLDALTDSKLIDLKGISHKVNIPNIELQKDVIKDVADVIKDVAEKVEVPMVENPKEDQKMGIPGVSITNIGSRIEKLIENKDIIVDNNKPIITIPKVQPLIQLHKVGDKIVDNKAEQQKKQIEDKKIIKENKNMVEELMEEYKRDQWAKKRDFERNIEDMARVAAENKGQISGISHKIEDVEGKIGDVEGKIGDVDNKIGGLQENIQEKFGTLQGTIQERLGNLKKPVSDVLGELCTGVDCIKEDVKNIKKSQETYADLEKRLESNIESKLGELGERLTKLEEPSFVCDNCGQDSIRPLSSFCPNCGSPIHNWTDPETGMAVQGWIPYWKRRGYEREIVE